jgi:murein DD-endopeptidase MepM/ murein hydrolase activator NlpD
MIKIFIFTLFSFWLFGATVVEKRWIDGETFSDYILKNGIPINLIGKISANDIQYLSEIQSGERFYELRDGDRLIQALIPIGEEMQIKLSQNLKTKQYSFDIIPIVYKKVRDRVTVEIKRNCYRDLDKLTNNRLLNYILKKMYQNILNFRYLRVGDKIAFEYLQKSRLGKPWGQPKILGALIHTRGKDKFVFRADDGSCWGDTYKEVNVTKVKKSKLSCRGFAGKSFIMPLKKIFITSRFTYKRWHPILHRYRPHLGVDFRGKRGTSIYAINDGKIIYAGWMRGYGKVTKIKHSGGYVSLYAHQSKIRVKLGDFVRRGDIIGEVGNTGRSTGPHLHLGLYKNGKAINPLSLISKKSKKQKEVLIKIKTIKKVEIKGAKSLKKRLKKWIKRDNSATYKWEKIDRNYIWIDELMKESYDKK